MNITQKVEMVFLVGTLTIITAFTTIITPVEPVVIATIVVSWCIWGIARLNLSEHLQLALGMTILMPAMAINYLVQDGMLYALFAIPALMRAVMLTSFHYRVLNGFKFITRDFRMAFTKSHTPDHR